MNNLSKALYGAVIAFAALATANPAAAGRYQTLDDLFNKVASEAEGFAGAWYTEDGALNIAVKLRGRSLTSTEQKRALGALVDVFGKGVLEPTLDMKRPQPGIGTVAFRQPDYSWRDLYDWYRDVRAVLKLRGVGSTDIDERKNRIVIVFPGGKPTADVINYLATIDAPFSAILFGTSDKLYYYYSGSIIGSEQTPYLGGIELGLQQGGRCTLGLNVLVDTLGPEHTYTLQAAEGMASASE